MNAPLLRILAVSIVILVMVSAAAASVPRDLRNPWSVNMRERPDEKIPQEGKPPALPIIYAGVGLAGVCAVGLKRPKRSHLD